MRLFYLHLVHGWYIFISACVYVCISVSDFVWFTVLPGLSNRLQAEPAGRSQSVQARLDFAAPWMVHTRADTVCSLMGSTTSSGAHNASSAR